MSHVFSAVRLLFWCPAPCRLLVSVVVSATSITTSIGIVSLNAFLMLCLSQILSQDEFPTLKVYLTYEKQGSIYYFPSMYQVQPTMRYTIYHLCRVMN